MDLDKRIEGIIERGIRNASDEAYTRGWKSGLWWGLAIGVIVSNVVMVARWLP